MNIRVISCLRLSSLCSLSHLFLFLKTSLFSITRYFVILQYDYADVVYIPALNSITSISCIPKILASASLSASVNTTIYLCITRDLTGLECGNVLFYICILSRFFFFSFQYSSMPSAPLSVEL